MAERYEHDEDYKPEVLSLEDLAEIRRRWPAIPAYRIDRVATVFKQDRENKGARPGEVHNFYDELIRSGKSTAKLLASVCDDRRVALNVAERVSKGVFGARDLAQAIGSMIDAAEAAKAYFHKGAPPFKFDQQHLFEGLAEVVRGAGYVADRSEHGPLMRVAEMIFWALGIGRPTPFNFIDKQLSLEKRSGKI